MMYNWDVKIPGKEKKNYYCKEHKFNLMFTGLFILFILPLIIRHGLNAGCSFSLGDPPPSSPLFRRPRAARLASPGTLRVALRTQHPIISLLVSLRTTNAESEIIATLETK